MRYNEQRRDEGGRSSREGRSDSRSRSDSVRADARACSESGNRAAPESTEDLENSMLKVCSLVGVAIVRYELIRLFLITKFPAVH